MNEYEAERIAQAINVLRPDWPVRSLITLMGREQLRHRPRRDVLVAFAWVAAETNTSNPGRVLEAGPWWKAVAADGSTGGHPHPLRAGDPEECRTHPGQHRDHCGPCASEAAPEPTYGIAPMDADTNGLGDDETHAYDGLTGREFFAVRRQEMHLRNALEPKTETKEEAS